MSSKYKYVPILRSKDREIAVLKAFEFGYNIIPYIEVVKESVKIRRSSTAADGKKILPKPPTINDFQIEFDDLIGKINSDKVFIDIPSHIKIRQKMESDVKQFLTKVAGNLETKNSYLLRLTRTDHKVIPVISSYLVQGISKSIEIQYTKLTDYFPVIAVRASYNTLPFEMDQIKNVMKNCDYLFVDWDEEVPNLSEPDFIELVANLSSLKCKVVHLRSQIPRALSNTKLGHGQILSIDNTHIRNYGEFGASMFSDYAGIKKAELSGGAIISPGFIYYDAVTNGFLGFRYRNGSSAKEKLREFEITIIPEVVNCEATLRMHRSVIRYLTDQNPGWKVICDIECGHVSGLNQAKFKEISINHYMWCMKLNLETG